VKRRRHGVFFLFGHVNAHVLTLVRRCFDCLEALVVVASPAGTRTRTGTGTTCRGVCPLVPVHGALNDQSVSTCAIWYDVFTCKLHFSFSFSFFLSVRLK